MIVENIKCIRAWIRSHHCRIIWFAKFSLSTPLVFQQEKQKENYYISRGIVRSFCSLASSRKSQPVVTQLFAQEIACYICAFHEHELCTNDCTWQRRIPYNVQCMANTRNEHNFTEWIFHSSVHICLCICVKLRYRFYFYFILNLLNFIFGAFLFAGSLLVSTPVAREMCNYLSSLF